MLRRFQSVGKCGQVMRARSVSFFLFFEAISASFRVLIVNLIDLFTVSVAILVEGKHGKIYNKCMIKVGSLMLYNLRILKES